MPKHQILHVGINCNAKEDAIAEAKKFAELFDVDFMECPASAFTAGKKMEWMFGKGPGEHGHIAVGTENIPESLRILEQKGIHPIEGSEIIRDSEVIGIYLDLEIAGFAVHLLQTVPS